MLFCFCYVAVFISTLARVPQMLMFTYNNKPKKKKKFFLKLKICKILRFDLFCIFLKKTTFVYLLEIVYLILKCFSNEFCFIYTTPVGMANTIYQINMFYSRFKYESIGVFPFIFYIRRCL